MSVKSPTTYLFWIAVSTALIAALALLLFQSHDENKIHHPVDSKKWLRGIDVSHYQGNIDWHEVKVIDKISFVYIKSTEGDKYLDPKYKSYVYSLDKNDIPFGTYHFFRPMDDPVRQAKHYLENLPDEAILPPVVDIEITDNMPKKEIAMRLEKWLDIVSQRTGCQPVIYTYKDYWSDYLGDKFTAYRLWLADYQTRPNLPADKQQWVIWQHKEELDLDGIKGKVDSDYFHGGKSALESFSCSNRGKQVIESSNNAKRPAS